MDHQAVRQNVEPMNHILLDARTATDHFPGIGRYVVNLSQALTQIAPALGLVLLRDPSATATRLTWPDLPRIACSASPFSIKQQWIVPRLVRQVGAKLYHSPYYLMPYQPGVPSVVTCYDLIPLIYPEYFTGTQRLIYRLTHVLALRAARMVLAISEATKADLVRVFHLDPQRIHVTPLAADSSFTPGTGAQIAAVHAKYVLPEQYVLYLGINKPHKNLGRLVQAWRVANLKAQVPNLKLVIAGQWDERYPEARRLAKELDLQDQVVFVGPVGEADLPALYSGAMLFVFPSLYEGFGLPVLEAMACGTPVICSNTSSLPEVAGNAALLVDPEDVTALADALRHATNDEELRQALRKKGLSQASQFSWEKTAQETLTVYRHLM
jgi:glycosyltransferase involved in cell wall biosynthesis